MHVLGVLFCFDIEIISYIITYILQSRSLGIFSDGVGVLQISWTIQSHFPDDLKKFGMIYQ